MNDSVHQQGLIWSPLHAEVFDHLLLSQTAPWNPFSFIYSRLISLWPLALLPNRPETDKSFGTVSTFDDVNHWTSEIFLTSYVPQPHIGNLSPSASGCHCPNTLLSNKPYKQTPQLFINEDGMQIFYLFYTSFQISLPTSSENYVYFI